MAKSPSLVIENIWNAPKAFLLSQIFREEKKTLLIITNGKREDRYFDNFPFFQKEPVLEFPAWETLPGEEISPSPDILGKRFQTLFALTQNDHPKILLAPLQSVLQKLPSKENLFFFEWKVGDEVPFSSLESLLKKAGYERSKVVSDKKEFALRGGILDIFPTSSTEPFRIEFFGDEIESIRTFDPISQKSIEKVSEIFIPPADEQKLLQEEKNLHTLFDFLGDTIIIFDDLLALEDAFVSLINLPGAKSPFLLPFEALLQNERKKIFFAKERLEELSRVQKKEESVSFEMCDQKIESTLFHHAFAKPRAFFGGEGDLLDHLYDYDFPKLKLHFLYETEKYKENLEQDLKKRGIKPDKIEKGYLSSGFVLTDITYALIPEAEVVGKERIRRQKWRSTYHTPAAEFHELSPGDLVVHFHSGIGKYLGTEKQKNHLGIESEFLIIEYAKESKLFVPLAQSHLVSRYIGSSEAAPTLSQLGTKRWHQIKTKAQKEIIGYASDLLHLYAERQLENAFPHSKLSEMTDEFEEDFPYVPTPDQLSAIAAIKEDMSKKKPMDRLICGDVGYGKTEVAMRAAFKAVADGKKQVAVLVPTTVLAMQHFDTFKERMANYPIMIEVLSRFRTAKQNRETAAKVKEGTIDIAIGTHRILSKDVTFKNLGLIIIDEEQRFGVRAKEHLKKLKKEAHCLTLSATPIPRTLYMSLITARDMSVISTPPQDRLPIKTIIAEAQEEVIENALLRELAREGQAFFIHNRVETIYKRAENIQKLVPKAKIAVVHGQLPPDDVDRIFHEFKMGKVDILFATTIVESGIDIPNANTILIDRADTYGLADLYQLRGRVGRWNRAAYAYFLIPPKKTLTEIARKRLHALLETSGYGGGMKVAMRDLEIRGAGDILGVQQSGQVSAIGFHLYCKLLKKTIEAIKNKKPVSFIETKMEFSYDANLPESYINESSLRMEIYHRLGEASSFSAVDMIYQEMRDRFGKPPKQVLFLYHLTRIRIFASEQGFTRLKFGASDLLAELQRGKKILTETTYIPKKIQNPKDLEIYVIDSLKKKFSL